MAEKDLGIYQLKISLMRMKPPIWRRVLVPADFTFRDLHLTIQDAFSWRNYHLHQFQIKNTYILATDYFNDPYVSTLPEKTTNIRDHFVAIGCKVLYVYDLGDNWRHEIELEKILERKEGWKYPRCIAGRTASPPEDGGGYEGSDEEESMDDVEQEASKPVAKFDPKAIEFKRLEKGDNFDEM